jgi:hypothetical protein
MGTPKTETKKTIAKKPLARKPVKISSKDRLLKGQKNAARKGK